MLKSNLRNLFAVFLFLFLGCATNRPIDKTATEQFETAVRTWSVEGKIYRNLNLLLSACATYMSPDLRNAYAGKYAQDHFLSDKDKEKKISEEQKKAEKGLEFIVCIVSDKESWNNLADKDSIWSIALVDNAGHTIKPSTIIRLDPVPVYIADFFPNMTHWKKVYSVIFPKNVPGSDASAILADTQDFTLNFRSAIGQLSLTF